MDDIHTRRDWLTTTLTGVTGVVAAAASTTSVLAQAAKTITVRVVDKAGYDRIIKANKGKVIVVDCWATWCVPCRKAFPKTVELGKTYADKDVVIVTLCFDDPVKGQAPESVKQFLATNDAYFENLISSLEISGNGAEVFEIPEGALPHFKIYGKDGKLFKVFESGDDKDFSHKDIEAAVKSVLKASKS